MQKITPFLWFDDNLEDAMNFYVNIFDDARILSVSRAGADGPVFTATFELAGQTFMGLNGGPEFKFTEALSLFVNCEDQAEVERLWEQLSAGGEIQMCGWLKDKFGVSWQIIPKQLGELMGDPDPAKAKRVMDAMLQMKKIDVAALQKAHAGE